MTSRAVNCLRTCPSEGRISTVSSWTRSPGRSTVQPAGWRMAYGRRHERIRRRMAYTGSRSSPVSRRRARIRPIMLVERTTPSRRSTTASLALPSAGSGRGSRARSRPGPGSRSAAVDGAGPSSRPRASRGGTARSEPASGTRSGGENLAWVQVGWWKNNGAVVRGYCEVQGTSGSNYTFFDFAITAASHSYSWTYDAVDGYWDCYVDNVGKTRQNSGLRRVQFRNRHRCSGRGQRPARADWQDGTRCVAHIRDAVSTGLDVAHGECNDRA